LTKKPGRDEFHKLTYQRINDGRSTYKLFTNEIHISEVKVEFTTLKKHYLFYTNVSTVQLI